MKFNSLVFSLFMVSKVFASQGTELDSMPNIASATSIATVFSMTNLETQATAIDVVMAKKEGCKKPIGCQLHKYVLIKYNNSSDIARFIPMQVSENDEVRALAQIITLTDKVGNIIYPLRKIVEVKTDKGVEEREKLYLPLMQEGNECPDYEMAKCVIEPYEMSNPVGPLGLVEKFDQFKKGLMLCVECKTNHQPNIPSQLKVTVLHKKLNKLRK